MISNTLRTVTRAEIKLNNVKKTRLLFIYLLILRASPPENLIFNFCLTSLGKYVNKYEIRTEKCCLQNVLWFELFAPRPVLETRWWDRDINAKRVSLKLSCNEISPSHWNKFTVHHVFFFTPADQFVYWLKSGSHILWSVQPVIVLASRRLFPVP